MEMIFPLVIALFLVYRPGSSAATVKERLRDFLANQTVSRHFLFGTAALLIGTSVFVTLSRGGIISLTLSMLVLSFWLTKKAKTRKAGLVLGVIFVGILVLTGSEAWNLIFERFGQIRNESGEIYSGRFEYWKDGRAIIGDFPVTGSGAGTWKDIFPVYQVHTDNSKMVEHAHNDYIEFLATGGFLLAGLMALALWRVAAVSYASYKMRRDRFATYLFAACMTAVLAILLHSFFDFNMQVGANGLYFFLVLAVAVSAAHNRFFHGMQGTYLRPVFLNRRMLAVPAVLFLLLVAVVNGGILPANYHFYPYENGSPAAGHSKMYIENMHRAAERAADFDPLNATYQKAAADTAALLKEPAARDYYRAAMRLNPLNFQILQDAGYFFAGQKDIAAAETLMRAGIAYRPHRIEAYLNYASLLFETGKTDRGLAVLKRAVEDEPENTAPCLSLMAWFGISKDRMAQALPKRTRPYLAFGDYLVSLGNYAAAAFAYEKALSCVAGEEAVKRRWFVRVYRFYEKRGKTDRARTVIERARMYLPEDERLRRLATSH